MPGFVLLLHHCPKDVPRPTHCDLMVEAEGVLRTWVLERLPNGWSDLAERTADEIACPLPVARTMDVTATRLADHRLDYLDYEGPVGGDRGTVRRLDAGTYEMLAISPDACELSLAGKRLRGILKLTLVGESGDQWRLEFAP